MNAKVGDPDAAASLVDTMYASRAAILDADQVHADYTAFHAATGDASAAASLVQTRWGARASVVDQQQLIDDYARLRGPA